MRSNETSNKPAPGRRVGRLPKQNKPTPRISPKSKHDIRSRGYSPVEPKPTITYTEQRSMDASSLPLGDFKVKADPSVAPEKRSGSTLPEQPRPPSSTRLHDAQVSTTPVRAQTRVSQSFPAPSPLISDYNRVNSQPAPSETSFFEADMEDSDDLPTIRQMLDDTRPSYSVPTQVPFRAWALRRSHSIVNERVIEWEGRNGTGGQGSFSELLNVVSTPRSAYKQISSNTPRASTMPISGPALRPKRLWAFENADRTNGPPQKRFKGVNKYTKHPMHWVLDGNALVQIGNVRYRLHRSRLIKHSEWFRRHYEDTQENQEDLFDLDGRTVVTLDKTGIIAEDFDILLDAMDAFMEFSFEKPPFQTVCSILRAAAALSFTHALAWASKYFMDMWPDSLDKLSTARTSFATESIYVARQCKLPRILKRAFYELLRSEGFGQDDIELDTDPLPTRLSFKDYEILVKAREKLTSHWLTATTYTSSHFESCKSDSAQCVAHDAKWADQAHVKLVFGSGIFEEYLYDPICGMQALIDAPWADEGFCAACVEVRKSAWRRGKERAWEHLDLFGFSGNNP